MEAMMKVPPHDLRAEQSLLGALILRQDVYDDLHLKASDFYRNVHQELFDVIETLIKNNKNVDMVTIMDELNYRAIADAVGGIVYLNDLTTAGIIYSNAHAWEEIIIKKSLSRRRINIASEVIDMEYSGNDASVVLKSMEDIDDYGSEDDYTHVGDVALDVADEMHEYQNSNEAKGLQTGLVHFDYYLDGLKNNDLYYIAARPSMGKTAFMLELIKGVAKRNKKVAVFSLEMDKKSLTQRLLVNEGQINLDVIKRKKMNEEDWDRLGNATNSLSRQKIYINDTPRMTVSKMVKICKRIKKEHGLDLIALDYLQLLDSDIKGNKQEIVSENSRNLKLLARELGCPVIALSQLSRNVEQRDNKRPKLSDLRDSGSIEQDGDTIMFLYREDYYMKDEKDYENTGITEVIIGKQREGETATFPLMWYPKTQSFDDILKK